MYASHAHVPSGQVILAWNDEIDGLRAAGESFGSFRRGHAQLGGERAGFFARAIPESVQVAAAREVARHVRSHRTETDETHAHRLPPTAGAAAGEL